MRLNKSSRFATADELSASFVLAGAGPAYYQRSRTNWKTGTLVNASQYPAVVK